MEAHDGSLLGTLKYGVDSQPPTRDDRGNATALSDTVAK
jgi:hypothetical protein